MTHDEELRCGNVSTRLLQLKPMLASARTFTLHLGLTIDTRRASKLLHSVPHNKIVSKSGTVVMRVPSTTQRQVWDKPKFNHRRKEINLKKHAQPPPTSLPRSFLIRHHVALELVESWNLGACGRARRSHRSQTTASPCTRPHCAVLRQFGFVAGSTCFFPSVRHSMLTKLGVQQLNIWEFSPEWPCAFFENAQASLK